MFSAADFRCSTQQLINAVQITRMVGVYVLALLALATATPLPQNDNFLQQQVDIVVPADAIDYQLPATIKALRDQNDTSLQQQVDIVVPADAIDYQLPATIKPLRDQNDTSLQQQVDIVVPADAIDYQLPATIKALRDQNDTSLQQQVDIVVPADAIDYRLPTIIKPLRYNIKLVPFITEGNFTFNGEVLIAVQALEATSTIVLHANKLTIDTKTIEVKNFFTNEVLAVNSAAWNEKTHFFTITLAEELVASTQYTIHFNQYTGVLDNDNKGFFRSSYVESGVTRWLAATQFEETDARRAFPCFDEPALKARISLAISRPDNMRAISNMPQIGGPEKDTVNTDVLRYWDRFEESPPMSTYLLAFVVSDFVFMENAAENFRIFAQPSLISQARYGLHLSPLVLNWLVEYTGIPFHLPKIDGAVIPNFFGGAMENWGLITYSDLLLLFEEGVSTSGNRQEIATSIAHEYAHQWFGDLVSPYWWKYTWLNEGLANYFGFVAAANVETTWRLEEQYVVSELHYAMSVDDVQDSHPITIDVASPESISAIIETILYSKAGSVIRMMKHFVTPATFQRGINRYLKARSYQAAVADDLFDNMNDQLHEDNPDAADVDVKEVMDTWSLQMGYPVVTVTRNYAAKSAELTQERFLMKEIRDHSDAHDYKWHIPLTYTTQGAPDFESTSPKDWFSANDTTKTISGLPGPNEWVLFNVAQSSYYRVNYDSANWALLTAHLDSDKFEDIHVLNRAQLIDDSYNLAKSGLIDPRVPLTLSRYLRREVDYIVWYPALNAFNHINNKMLNIEDYSTFQSYLLTLMTRLYTTVGYDQGANDDHVMKLTRVDAVGWACEMGNADCVAKSKSSFAQWMVNADENEILPDLKGSTYCTAVKAGAKPEWDFLLEQYVRNLVPATSPLMITALGRSKDTAVLKTYLDMAMTNGTAIRKSDWSEVFSSVHSNPVGVDVALDYVVKEFKKISDYTGEMENVGKLMVKIADNCNSQAQSDKMSAFLAANTAELGTAAASVTRAIETVRENMAWQTTYGKPIIDWIKANPITSPTNQDIDPTILPVNDLDNIV